MKLLLCKNVDHLGIVGDVVDVSSGYARNYLLPKLLATEPTEANTRKLAEATGLEVELSKGHAARARVEIRDTSDPPRQESLDAQRPSIPRIGHRRTLSRVLVTAA